MKTLQLFDDDIKPWEKQHGESDSCYQAFCIYRDLGRSRSVRQTAVNLGKSQSPLRQASITWKWVERAACWGEELDRIKREAMVKEVSDMGKRHAQQAIITLRTLSQPASELLKRIQDNPDIFNNLTNAELFDKVIKSAQVLSQVIDIERKSRGEPNEILKNDITSDGNKIRIIRPSLNNNDIAENNEHDI